MTGDETVSIVVAVRAFCYCDCQQLLNPGQLASSNGIAVIEPFQRNWGES
jgi:hypothetical protein